MTPGLVSVVVPMKNARAFVGPAVASIAAERDVPLEVIVVDDGSTDGSGDIVRAIGDARVRIVPGPCQGNIPLSVNAGLAQASGEFFMRCDADDVIVPGRVARQRRWLMEHAEFVAVCGSFDTIDPAGRELSVMHSDLPAGEITEELRRGQTRTHLNTFLVHMATVRQIGGFRPYFSGTEDIDFQLRVGATGRVWYDPAIVYRYRLHGASSTHTQATARREFLTATARRFALQRQETGTDDLERGCPPTPPDDGSPAAGAVEHMQEVLIGRAWREHRAGQRLTALRTALRAASRRPSSLWVWRNLLFLCVKRA